MAGTTTNYGWTYPTSTDLVKDGATAIQTLASGIDTSMNAALSVKPTMAVFLNATTFTTASSATIDNVFSTAYDNYRIILTTTSVVTPGTITATLRTAAPADLNAASYGYINTGFSATSATTPGTLGSSASGTSAIIGYTNGNSASWVGDILNAPIAQPTIFNGLTMSSSATDVNSTAHAGVYKVSVAAFGIRFNFAGNCTGTIKVYGYRNS